MGDVVTTELERVLAELIADGAVPDGSGCGTGVEVCNADDGYDGCGEGRTAGADCWSTTTSVVGCATVSHEDEEGSVVAERKENWCSSKSTCLEVITHHD